MSNIDKELFEQLKVHLVGKASKIVNSSEFRSSLVRLNVLDESDLELKSWPELQEAKWAERAIKLACSKGAIGSLVLALQASNNEHVLGETVQWLESSQPRKKNYPISVKSLATQRNTEKSKTLLRPRFCDQAALPDHLTKVATFQCPQNSCTKGITAVQFNKERMMPLAADGKLYVWNLGSGEEEPIAIEIPDYRDLNEKITCFQFDEEILVVGTGGGGGHVYLFDARTYQSKSNIFFGPYEATSLKFVESTLLVVTLALEDGINQEGRWIDISRPNKRLLDKRGMDITWARRENQVPGICMYPDISFVYFYDVAHVFDTRSGDPILDEKQHPCCLRAPYEINTLTVADLISRKRVVVAGSLYGAIGVWETSKLKFNSAPLKVLWGQSDALVGVWTVGGHLLGLDKTGKILTWSGYDLEKDIPMPFKRVEAEDCPSVSSLGAYERWFALQVHLRTVYCQHLDVA